MVERIVVPTVLPDDGLKESKKGYTDPSHYKWIINRDTDVFLSDGSLVLSFREHAILDAYWEVAWPAVLSAAKHTNNRRDAQGTAKVFRSGTFGVMDGKAMGFNEENPRAWEDIVPLIRAMSDAFREIRPEEYARHLKLVEESIRPDCLARDSVFTTFTANRKTRQAYHDHLGNMPGTLGALTVAGEFSGGMFVLPKYRVAVNVRSCDLLLADNREVHGNTKMYGHRVSLVAYVHSSNVRRS